MKTPKVTHKWSSYHPRVVASIENYSNIANETSNAPENRTIGYNGDFLPWKTIWRRNDELLFSFKRKYAVSSCKCFQIAHGSLIKAVCLANRGRCPPAVHAILVVRSDWPEPKPHGSYVCTVGWSQIKRQSSSLSSAHVVPARIWFICPNER